MKHITIGKRFILGFTSVILIAAILGGFSYTRLTRISGHADQVSQQALPAVKLVYRVQRNVMEAAALIYKHVGTDDPADMRQLEERLKAILDENTQSYDELQKLITDAKTKQELEKTTASRAEYVRIRTAVVEFSRRDTNNIQAYHMARTQLDAATENYVSVLGALADFIKADANQAAHGIQAAVQSSKWAILVGLSLAVVIGVLVAVLITRNTNRVLKQIAAALTEGSGQVSSAAAQVSSSSQSLAQGASQQASSMEETSSSLEEISSMTRRNADNSHKANELAKQTRSAAELGAQDMQEMIAAMDGIKTSSDEIANIIKTIDEIAFQTNILALNAAVEAARAGDAGMGFAVVAEEVRSLAQRSAKAAKETSDKIEGAISKAGQGVTISDKVAQRLNSIVVHARQVDELVAEVASASQEQSQGINLVNSSVTQIDQITQSNAANAEESAAASEELNAQAAAMKEAVNELLALVGAHAESESPQPEPALARTSLPRHFQPKKASPPQRLKPASPAAGSFKRSGPAQPAAKPAGRKNTPATDGFEEF